MMYGEHLVRYEYAARFAKGKTVLDIACGSGYGTQLLAAQATKVIGVDVSAEAVGYAKKHFPAKNVEYRVGDGQKIPLGDASVDLVVSFETIEHVKDYKTFLSELHRVLKPGGVLVISTPNDAAYPQTNEFHLHEFTFSEIKSLLGEHFPKVQPMYQGSWIYSGLFDEKAIAVDWREQMLTLGTAPVKPEEAIYFVFVCSDKAISMDSAPIGALSEAWSVRAVDEYVQSMKNHMEEQRKVMDHLAEQLEIARGGSVKKAARKVKRMLGGEKQ
jgi:ubiquinone/menaquinone biosynthesis C-methylase UbiE